MRSIPLALAWEVSCRWWLLLLGLLGANALTIVLVAALRMEFQFDPMQPELLAIQVVLMQMNMLLFGSTILYAQGLSSRLYTYPIRNEALVGWHMVQAMVLIACEVALSTVALNFIFGLQWPIWGPGLLAAAAMAAVQAIIWLTGKTVWFFWSVGLLGTVLGLWHKSRYGTLFDLPTHPWAEVTVWEVAFLAAMVGVSYWLGVVGVGRNRCGESLGSLGFFEWLAHLLDSNLDEKLAFKSPVEAQFWFVWQRKGWMMPVMVVVCILGGLGIWLSFIREPEALIQAFVVGGGMLSALALVAGLAFGHVGPTDSRYDMGHFLGTRPMSTIDISRTILKAGALSTLVTWSIWAVAFAGVFAILFLTNSLPDPLLPGGLQWWYLPATLLGCWTVLGWAASAGLIGDLKWFGYVYGGVVAMGTGLTLLAKFALTPEAQSQLHSGVLVVSGIALVVATIWAFARAYHVSLVSRSLVAVAVVAWVVLSGIALYEWFSHPLASFPTYLFVIGLLAASQAPFATAPLALACNRNQ